MNSRKKFNLTAVVLIVVLSFSKSYQAARSQPTLSCAKKKQVKRRFQLVRV